MRIVNSLVALLLAVATAALGLLFIGSQEQRVQMLEQHFWSTLGLRFAFASAIGLIGAVFWWGVNRVLLKAGFAKGINLHKIAFWLAASAISGSLIGGMAFCLL